MKISILCTDPHHPVINSLNLWINEISLKGHSPVLIFDKVALQGGDILFLVSCSQMIRDAERKKYKATLVLHASDLPKGRGWSPHIWSILGGGNQITVSLLEASEPVSQLIVGQYGLRQNLILKAMNSYQKSMQNYFRQSYRL
jgi:methionyl-tRNA formyltransferase